MLLSTFVVVLLAALSPQEAAGAATAPASAEPAHLPADSMLALRPLLRPCLDEARGPVEGWGTLRLTVDVGGGVQGLDWQSTLSEEDRRCLARALLEVKPALPAGTWAVTLRELLLVTTPEGKTKVQYRGSLSREEIEEVMQAHQAELRACYDAPAPRSATSPPGTAKQIRLQIVIGGDGTVSRVGFDGAQVGDAQITSCLLGAVRGMTFPPPRGGGSVVVTYPSGAPATPEPGTLPPPDDKQKTKDEWDRAFWRLCCGCLL